MTAPSLPSGIRKTIGLLVTALLPHLLCVSADADLLTPLASRRVKKPVRGMQMVVGPVETPSGSEITTCTYFKNPSTKDMAVNRIRIEVQGGSHHIHLYRPVDRNIEHNVRGQAGGLQLRAQLR